MGCVHTHSLHLSTLILLNRCFNFFMPTRAICFFHQKDNVRAQTVLVLHKNACLPSNTQYWKCFLHLPGSHPVLLFPLSFARQPARSAHSPSQASRNRPQSRDWGICLLVSASLEDLGARCQHSTGCWSTTQALLCCGRPAAPLPCSSQGLTRQRCCEGFLGSQTAKEKKNLNIKKKKKRNNCSYYWSLTALYPSYFQSRWIYQCPVLLDDNYSGLLIDGWYGPTSLLSPWALCMIGLGLPLTGSFSISQSRCNTV